MHTAILCFGSNLPTETAGRHITQAMRLMEASATLVRTSDIYPSSSGYENLVTEMRTKLPYSALLALTKATEAALGRTPEMKDAGIVPIDIDIVYFDGEALRPADIATAYFKQGIASMHPIGCAKRANLS